MPMNFEMDVSSVVEWAEELVSRRGVARAQRIIDCQRPHRSGIDCVCGWLDDPPMPVPKVVEMLPDLAVKRPL
jgi:hypothetical protein